ncbi:MAG TPA: aspartate aminotransferase family protein [Planctomycetes bacterium]|nr:aspartate aminotransferase family protein [Planctomycetota bacterium]
MTPKDIPQDAATSHEFDAYRRLDLEVIEAKGCHLVTGTGRRLLDLYGGHAAALLGHSHPRLVAALTAQADRLFFQTNLVKLPVRERAARALADFAPAGLDRVFFVNSGAEANENALRLAFRHTRRHTVIALTGSFHGRTAAAAACTDGSEAWYGFPAWPFSVRHLPWNNAALLEDAVTDDVAAVIVEPIQGIAGARAIPVEVLQAARRACDARSALLIADEVQCGMGRSGRAFAIEEAQVTPDVLTVAKGLAGGFPAGAVIARHEVAATIRPGDLGSTFGGGPLAAALIAEVIAVVRDEDLVARADRLGRLIRERCLVGPVESIQGRGLLVGLRLDRPASDVAAQLRERDILVGTSSDPRVIRLMPPLVLQDEHVEQLAQALQEISSS